MNARAARAAAPACSTSTSSSSPYRAFSTTTPAARSRRPLASPSTPSSSSRSRVSPLILSEFHITNKRMLLRSRQLTLRAVPEVADALNLAASSTSTSLAEAISSSSSTPLAAAGETAATAAASLAASIARYASAAMLTLAELTNEATTAVAAEETRVVSSLTEVITPSTTSTSLSASVPLNFLASLPASIFDPPHPEPANALSLPTWAIHVSSVAEWVVAMNLFWKLGGIPGGVPQWRGMSWGMLPLLGGALCACTFHFFYNSPSLAPLVALQAGLTVLGNATMWFAAWRVFEATRGRREAEEKEKKEKEKKEKEKEQQQQQA